MSIKINLLPNYVGLRRWFRRLLWGAAALVSIVGTVLFVLYYRDKQQLEKLTADYENLATNEGVATKAKAAAEAATTEAAPIETTVRFFVDAGQTGVKRAALLDLIRRYIYGPNDPLNYGAVVSSIDISDGQTLTMNATVRTPEDYQTFLLNLRLGSATYPYPLGTVFAADPRSNSVIPSSGLPGFPAAKPVVAFPDFQPKVVPYLFSVRITAPLKTKLTVPTEPGGAAAPAAGGAAAPPAGAPPGGAPPITPPAPTTPTPP